MQGVMKRRAMQVESRGHNLLSTFFKNRETANKFATGQSQIPTPQERKEAEKKEVKESAPVAPAPHIHRIAVTVSDPDHPAVTKRDETQQKFVRVTHHTDNKDEAIARGKKHFAKKGWKVHDAHYAGNVHESLEEAHKISLLDLIAGGDEDKTHHSNLISGWMADPEYKKKFLEGRKKMPPQTQEQIEKRAKSNTGKKHTEEHKAKVSEALRNRSPEVRKAIRDKLRGKKRNPEIAKKVAAKQIGKFDTQSGLLNPKLLTISDESVLEQIKTISDVSRY